MEPEHAVAAAGDQQHVLGGRPLQQRQVLATASHNLMLCGQQLCELLTLHSNLVRDTLAGQVCVWGREL